MVMMMTACVVTNGKTCVSFHLVPDTYEPVVLPMKLLLLVVKIRR